MIIKPMVLDVSELEAPEPMRKILTSLTQLRPGQCLLVMHRKEPQPLYPKLLGLGFAFVVKDRGHSITPQYLIGIAHACDFPLIQQYMAAS